MSTGYFVKIVVLYLIWPSFNLGAPFGISMSDVSRLLVFLKLCCVVLWLIPLLVIELAFLLIICEYDWIWLLFKLKFVFSCGCRCCDWCCDCGCSCWVCGCCCWVCSCCCCVCCCWVFCCWVCCCWIFCCWICCFWIQLYVLLEWQKLEYKFMNQF